MQAAYRTRRRVACGGWPGRSAATTCESRSAVPQNRAKGLAISAKRLSRKQRKDGNLTKDEFERINRKADKVLKKKADH
jgi:hypothetical protein